MRPATIGLLGMAAFTAVVSVTGTATAARAGGFRGSITCAPGTTVLYRAVGSRNAPMLVPAQVPATICTRNGAVVSVVPSFQALGPSSAPMIVPVNLGLTKCEPATVASVHTVGGGLTPPLQLVQVGPGLFAINPNATSTATSISVRPSVLTCF